MFLAVVVGGLNSGRFHLRKTTCLPVAVFGRDIDSVASLDLLGCPFVANAVVAPSVMLRSFV
jgi:hypothetical protein